MKNAHIAIASVLAFMTMAIEARSDSSKLPGVVVYSFGGLNWTIPWDLGGTDTEATIVKHLFIGDEIWAKLLFTTGSLEPIPRQVFESALQCLDVALYELPDGKMAHVWNGKYTPRFKGRLGSVRLDSKDPRYNKQGYRATEGGSDGVYTEWFDVARLLGGSVPAGIYQFAAIPDPSCSAKYNFQGYGQGDLSVIQIHEANTPELKAMKLCFEGMKELTLPLKGKSLAEIWEEREKRTHDLEMMKRLVKDNFLQALALKPDLKCALRHMALYCKAENDIKCFEEYWTSYCKPQGKFDSEQCLRSMRVQIQNWDPRR